MLEPFMLATSSLPDGDVWFHKANIEFHDPGRRICLLPMSTPVIACDRPFYTKDECEADNGRLWKAAVDNTANIPLRISVSDDLVSLRSAKSAGTPCAGVLLLPGGKRISRLMGSVDAILKNKKMPPAADHYFVFITPDEILLADKAKLKASVLKKTVKNIRNRLAEENKSLLLATEVLEYDAEDNVYHEV
ncbi:MAG: hypothetical protein NC311_12430 [Muribaculaceae bacterium]|nr:hypothetical protein [Muribaculaceae bacterium]